MCVRSGYNLQPTVFDSTSLQLFSTCPALFSLRLTAMYSFDGRTARPITGHKMLKRELRMHSSVLYKAGNKKFISIFSVIQGRDLILKCKFHVRVFCSFLHHSSGSFSQSNSNFKPLTKCTITGCRFANLLSFWRL